MTYKQLGEASPCRACLEPHAALPGGLCEECELPVRLEMKPYRAPGERAGEFRAYGLVLLGAAIAFGILGYLAVMR